MAILALIVAMCTFFFPQLTHFSGYIPATSRQRRGSWGGHRLCQLFSQHCLVVCCMLNVVSAGVYSVNLNILCSFLHVTFSSFVQIAFSQHNSIMDLVQFFVTFFRWVSRRYTWWQLPQSRTPHPEHSADPLHLLSSSRPLRTHVTPEEPVGVVASLSAFTCAVVTCVTSSSDDCLQPASRCQWPSGQHRWMMSSVEAGHRVPPGELGVTLVSLC